MCNFTEDMNKGNKHIRDIQQSALPSWERGGGIQEGGEQLWLWWFGCSF